MDQRNAVLACLELSFYIHGAFLVLIASAANTGKVQGKKSFKWVYIEPIMKSLCLA
jgi:hypothetical protein